MICYTLAKHARFCEPVRFKACVHSLFGILFPGESKLLGTRSGALNGSIQLINKFYRNFAL